MNFVLKDFKETLQIFVSLRGAKQRSNLVLLIFIICSTGCQTPVVHKPKETQGDAVSAITTMTQGLTNQPVSEAQLKNLAKQVAHDPQAQSAIRSINTALSPVHTVKYCPENGERFSSDLIWCPDKKVKLEWLE